MLRFDDLEGCCSCAKWGPVTPLGSRQQACRLLRSLLPTPDIRLASCRAIGLGPRQSSSSLRVSGVETEPAILRRRRLHLFECVENSRVLKYPDMKCFSFEIFESCQRSRALACYFGYAE